jgi:hypothetical protein
VLEVVTAPALEEMARCGEVKRRPVARRGCCRFAFRRTASALGGFEPKQRMGEEENGGPARRVVEEEGGGGLAAGKTHGRRRRAVSGDPDREKQGRRRSR